MSEPAAEAMSEQTAEAARQPIVVVAAIFADGDRVLACRRAPGRADAGLWEFPGGKVEPGESPEAALSREIREELGVDVMVGALVDRSTTVVGIRQIDLSCYLVTLIEADASPVAAVATSTDHDELRWVPRATPLALEWALPDLPAVHALALQP